MENLPDTSASITDLDLFRQTLGNNDTFALAVIGLVKFGDYSTIHLKDTAQRILSIISLIYGQTHATIESGRSRTYIQREDVIQFTNTPGQAYLTARGSVS